MKTLNELACDIALGRTCTFFDKSPFELSYWDEDEEMYRYLSEPQDVFDKYYYEAYDELEDLINENRSNRE